MVEAKIVKLKEELKVKNWFKDPEDIFIDSVEEMPQQAEDKDSKRAITRNQRKKEAQDRSMRGPTVSKFSLKNAFEGCKFGCECKEGDEFKGRGDSPLAIAGSVEPSESTLMRCEPKPNARRSTRIFDERTDVASRSSEVQTLKRKRNPKQFSVPLERSIPKGSTA